MSTKFYVAERVDFDYYKQKCLQYGGGGAYAWKGQIALEGFLKIGYN